MPGNVSQWRMEIVNFHNSTLNFLCGCAFYLGKSLMVITYILHVTLFKDIVNLTLLLLLFLFVCLFVFAVFRKKG